MELSSHMIMIIEKKRKRWSRKNTQNRRKWFERVQNSRISIIEVVSYAGRYSSFFNWPNQVEKVSLSPRKPYLDSRLIMRSYRKRQSPASNSRGSCTRTPLRLTSLSNALNLWPIVPLCILDTVPGDTVRKIHPQLSRISKVSGQADHFQARCKNFEFRNCYTNERCTNCDEC